MSDHILERSLDSSSPGHRIRQAGMGERGRLDPFVDQEKPREHSRCPHCGGDVRVIATVTEPAVIARVLEHLRRRELEVREPRGPPPLAA